MEKTQDRIRNYQKERLSAHVNLSRDLEVAKHKSDGNYSYEEARSVVSRAVALKDHDDSEAHRKKLDSILESDTDKGVFGTPIDRVYSTESLYNMAEGVNVPREYVDRVLNMHHPSEEKIRQDLIDVSATPTKNEKNKIYENIRRTYIAEIENELTRNLSPAKIKKKRLRGYGDRISFRMKEKGIIPSWFKRGKEIAEVSFYDYLIGIRQMQGDIIGVAITAKDPRFIAATKDRIDELSRKFAGPQFYMKYFYEY